MSPALLIDVAAARREIDDYLVAVAAGRFLDAAEPRRRLETLHGVVINFWPGCMTQSKPPPAAGAGRVATVGTGNAKPEGCQPSGSRGPGFRWADDESKRRFARGKRPAGGERSR
jgi:hypothetical protein